MAWGVNSWSRSAASVSSAAPQAAVQPSPAVGHGVALALRRLGGEVSPELESFISQSPKWAVVVDWAARGWLAIPVTLLVAFPRKQQKQSAASADTKEGGS